MDRYILLRNNLYYFLVVYLLIIVGHILSINFKPNIFYMFIINICQFFPIIFYHSYKKVLKKYISNELFDKILFMTYMSLLLIIPLLNGYFYGSSLKISDKIDYYLVKIIISFFVSWMYVGLIRKYYFSKNNKIGTEEYSLLLLMFVTFLQIIFTTFSNLIYVINDLLMKIIEDINYLNISIAIIMLCATLAMLSFSYYSFINDDLKKDKIKENGEGFFIATFLSVFSLISLYLFSIIKQQLNIMSIELNICSFEFILLNILIMIIIFFLITTIYALYYLLYGCISSLKILNFDLFD